MHILVSIVQGFGEIAKKKNNNNIAKNHKVRETMEVDHRHHPEDNINMVTQKDFGNAMN